MNNPDKDEFNHLKEIKLVAHRAKVAFYEYKYGIGTLAQLDRPMQLLHEVLAEYAREYEEIPAQSSASVD